MATRLESTDAKNKIENLSGVQIAPGANPYDALIDSVQGDPAKLQAIYSTHRVKRNALQKAKFLDASLPELVIDPFLLRLENPSMEPGFKDPRNCLVFWARPPEHVINLATYVQSMLKEAAPNLWLMPPQRMHMTTLEITHSKTPAEIAALVAQMRPSMKKIVETPFSHRSRLVKPMVSYDLSALALSFLPAAGEPVKSPAPVELTAHAAVGSLDDTKLPSHGHRGLDDGYTYHHLRREVFNLSNETGVQVESRYVVPSAHITLARYLGQDDLPTLESRKKWVEHIDKINAWLEDHWDQADQKFIGEWIVGQERGLDARDGALWYGGGRTIVLGEGF